MRENRASMNPFQKPFLELGETIGRNPGRCFGVYQPDRMFHMLLMGQTGTGKTTLLKNMILQDIEVGRGFCLIDPHGDLSEDLKPVLPKDAIYWDVANPDCPYGYNPLKHVSERYQPLVASGLIDALKKQWADAWGARMEHLLRQAVLALIARSGSSLADIVPMFTDRGFRSKVLQTVTDKEVLKFWREEYPKMNYKGSFDGVAPIANKLGAFLSQPVVRKSLCEPEEPLRFRKLMDEGTPIVISLSKGRLGTDVAEIMGGLILSVITQAAYSRVNIPEGERRPFFVYVDEFPNFTTSTIASMLSELRKFKTGLILAAQYCGQISTSILDSIFGNLGNLIFFRIGANDAPIIARQLGLADLSNLINQPNYRMHLRLMVDGKQTKTFTAQTVINESVQCL